MRSLLVLRCLVSGRMPGLVLAVLQFRARELDNYEGSHWWIQWCETRFALLSKIRPCKGAPFAIRYTADIAVPVMLHAMLVPSPIARA